MVMGEFFRIMLIWLVALAVPAQGMTAAAMMHCGPDHDSKQAAQHQGRALPEVSQVTPGVHAAHGHASHRAPDAGMANVSDQNATSLDALGAAQPHKVTDLVKVDGATYQKCSACTSCCSGVALTSTAPMPAIIDPAREATLLLAPWAASVVIDGPERPPRILRA